MDSAAKALIMAGSILIALALVGLGVYIFSRAKDLADTEQLDIVAIQQANAQLDVYAGTDIKGSIVKEFLNKVDLLNAKDSFPKDIVAGEITNYTFTATGTVITDANRGNIKENSYYEIALQDRLPDGNLDGYYDTYKIVEQ